MGNKVEWLTSDLFKRKYIVVGEWDLSSATNFPKEKVLSADTETHHFFNGQKLQDNDLSILYLQNGAKWCRENIHVKGYAYMLSNGKDFALFQCIEDFLTACAMFNVELVIWYNAKFDFPQFDSYMLTHGWKDSEDIVAVYRGKKRFRKLPPKTYRNLMDASGHRYCLELWVEGKDSSRHKRVRHFKMKDLLNVVSGASLDKQLKDWNITDSLGEEVRKLKMDYVNDTIEDSIQYMINDTKGLHLLALKVDEALKESSGYSFIEGDYMTAGGLAKKVMLDKMFHKDFNQNIDLLHEFFPITPEQDLEYRDKGLYTGGMCFVNPVYVGKSMENIYKYDVNSMYPDKMYKMLYPVGEPKILEGIPTVKEKGFIYIVVLHNFEGIMKKNRVPVWHDNVSGEYVETFFEDETHMIWLDELEELEWWYELGYVVDYVIQYKGVYSRGMRDYIDTFYNIKCHSKGSPKKSAKLLLNSAYGKWAQRIDRPVCKLLLNPHGNISIIKSTSYEYNKNLKSMMSVVVGSRITSQARIHLLKYIREICKNNPAKNFIYCDTDSVHALTPYNKCDDIKLGEMKCEGIYKFGKYLAPKTYLMYDNLNESSSKESDKWEVHTKGVNTKVVKDAIISCGTWERAFSLFAPGITFKCLTALNVVGGKALIYVDKMLVQPKNYHEIDEDERVD